MKKEYDFSKGKRGAVIQDSSGQTVVKLRLDDDIINWLREQVHAMGGGDYQNLVNDALREYMNGKQKKSEKGL